ncbi:unnamed protein product [Tuber aestivum]|uniref:Uncharacterized protein n=1 Tax=Tuber aestivum TaxID=59557 RepID=A0A292QA67_9PEZI|nr:unnamed protein product [Tuber aestivum]
MFCLKIRSILFEGGSPARTCPLLAGLAARELAGTQGAREEGYPWVGALTAGVGERRWRVLRGRVSRESAYGTKQGNFILNTWLAGG